MPFFLPFPCSRHHSPLGMIHVSYQEVLRVYMRCLEMGAYVLNPIIKTVENIILDGLFVFARYIPHVPFGL